MSAAYSTGTATGPGATDAFYQAIRTILTANGWSAHDVITDTTGVRDIVFKSGVLDATAGAAFFVRMTQTSTTRITFRGQMDWDAVTHAGVNEYGGTANSYIDTQDASFTYFLRVNEFALAMCAKIGASYHKNYFGFLRRGLATSKGGITKTSQAYASGVSTMNVASDMTAKLKVGQKVLVINFAHDSGSANATNIELMTIQSVAAGSVTFTANTTKAFDSGALIGWNPIPGIVALFTTSTSVISSTSYIAFDLDGSRTSATTHTTAQLSNLFSDEAATDPNDTNGEYSGGYWFGYVNRAGKTTHLGYYYHWEACSGGTQAVEDVMDDGDNTFIVLGAQSTVAIILGPR